MDGASAVVALVGFVATTITQVDKIITTLRNVQKNVSRLVAYLERLRSSLAGAQSLSARLSGKADQHESLEAIKGAVGYCHETLNRLEILVKKVKGSDSSSNKVKKRMTPLKFYFGRDEILEVQDQLHQAMTNLNVAVATHNSHL